MARRSPRLATKGRAKSASPKKRSPKAKKHSPKKHSPARRFFSPAQAKAAKKAHWSRALRADKGLTDKELQARIARARTIIAQLQKKSPRDLTRTSKRKESIRSSPSFKYWVSQSKTKSGAKRSTKGHRMADLIDPQNPQLRFDWGYKASELKKSPKKRKSPKKAKSPKRKAAKVAKAQKRKSPVAQRKRATPKRKVAKRKSPVAVARAARTRRAPSRLGFN